MQQQVRTPALRFFVLLQIACRQSENASLPKNGGERHEYTKNGFRLSPFPLLPTRMTPVPAITGGELLSPCLFHFSDKEHTNLLSENISPRKKSTPQVI